MAEGKILKSRDTEANEGDMTTADREANVRLRLLPSSIYVLHLY